MKHSKEELKLFQSFPLDVKMGKTALRIRELAEHDFYVSFSGGKDSEVAVDFVARTLSEIGIQQMYVATVSYTHLRAHETIQDLNIYLCKDSVNHSAKWYLKNMASR